MRYQVFNTITGGVPVRKEQMNLSKAHRFDLFLERLSAAPPAADREDALGLLKQTMDAVENEAVGVDAPFGDKMHVYGWEFQWKNLDSDPCHWDDSWSKVHRTEIYSNGRIVITRLRDPASTVLDKPGR